uniref:J domain-containing protein n=1 Tax=Salix viminalis TaxID=40686 RepID=A0A6N2MUS6_SALVM
MEDIGLVKQGRKWLQTQKHAYWRAKTAVGCWRDKIGVLIGRHWPMVRNGCARLGRLMRLVLIYWKDCVVRGFNSFIRLSSAALLLIMWSCFLSLTSMSCLLYVLLCMAAAGAAVQYLGYTPGLFIVGPFAILILWMYANFWITGTLFIVGGYLFSQNHARLVVLIAIMYAIYSVKVRVGWNGVFLSINLTFFSNDMLNFLLQWCDNVKESTQFEEHKETETVLEDEFSAECEFSMPADESEKVQSCKSSSKPAASSCVVNNQKESSVRKVVVEETSSADEMKRILDSAGHYEALGFPRHKRIDVAILKKEYRKKAMLVHPDKNLGSLLASESFKKLQCAYEVLSDSVKKRDYDEQLRKEESSTRSVCQKPSSTSCQDNSDYCSEESRRIQCTRCGNSHIWVCTNRTKAKARWCQDCCQYHQAKDGDGWVEYKGSLIFDKTQKMEIPRAFVCGESKIFDVSEWAICQGMQCRPNTHKPSFHVNMVGSEKTQRSNSSKYPWDLDAEMMDEEEEEFELRLQQALAPGRFFETFKRRKSWVPFKFPQKKGKKQWRRTST